MVLNQLKRLDKLDSIHDELVKDREQNKERFDNIEEKLEDTITTQKAMQDDIAKIKESDNGLLASMREDLDAMENAGARDTVIIKRYKIEGEMPADKKILSTMVLEIGKKLITTLLGDDKSMKYIAPLYFKNDKRPNARRGTEEEEDGRVELPPFRITFKQLSDAILFKDKAIAASKEPGNDLHKCYISNQQNLATRIRSMLLWGIVDQFKKEKKESWVSQSTNKPCLLIKEGGKFVKALGYLEAVTTYGEKIEQKVIMEATKQARRSFYGQVEKIFVILKD